MDCMQFQQVLFQKYTKFDTFIYVPYILLYNVDNVALTCRLEICTKLGVLWAFISRVETTPSTSATHHGYCRMCDKSSRKSCKALEFVITCHRKKKQWRPASRGRSTIRGPLRLAAPSPIAKRDTSGSRPISGGWQGACPAGSNLLMAEIVQKV